jgi:prepilin-type N-terminal cleavage/methylation domain-containing protein
MSRKAGSGYSLIEVMVAMAIFATVVLSVMSLFFLGRMNIYSGKKMTEAVMIGTKITEDLSGMTRDQITGAFVITDADGADNPVTVTVNSGKTYPASLLRNTTTGPGNATQENAAKLLTNWRDLAQGRFDSPLIEVVLTPTDYSAVANTEWATADFLKIRVIINWNEGKRRRRVVLDTVKSQAF